MNPTFFNELEDVLLHYGTKRHSGRYPWGSGENPFQHEADFLNRVDELKAQGFSESEIAKAIGLTTTELRVQKSLATNLRKQSELEQINKLLAEGKNVSEIGRIMGMNESSIRSRLNPSNQANRTKAMATAEFLKKMVDEKGMIDVGAGTEGVISDNIEGQLKISRETLEQALYILEREGYEVYGGGVPQVTNAGKQTNLKVLCPPGTEHKDIYDFNNVHTIDDYISDDGGKTYRKAFLYPASLDSSRLGVRYSEDGGTLKDGLIEIRPGVADLSLNGSTYAQVRILVDGDKYIKGMAVYSDDLPDGVDVMFNTKKSAELGKRGVLKDISNDPDNPFGSLIKEHGGQYFYDDPNGQFIDPETGKRQSLSLINKRADEGDWQDWSDTLSAQFLSKQNTKLIESQLGMTMDTKDLEYATISELTNPTIKRYFLQSFAEDCDSAAVHLKAAALPRQKFNVIFPLTTIGDDEVYAPNFQDGETVALVRYPHGGTFEIPILRVNNKLPEGVKILGPNPADVVGINARVGQHLSGADFDGDTVAVIPCNSPTSSIHITARPPLKGLEDFDTIEAYGPDTYKGKTVKLLSKGATQKQMGVASNLITDMTIKGADDEELARAVKHSMVIIDAAKHKLDYTRSERENGIKELKAKYQGHYDEDGKYKTGASTLISRAKSQVSVPKRIGSPKIDPETGELHYTTNPNNTYIDPKTGKTKTRMQKSTAMEETRDAYTLSTGTPVENLYANFANHLKSLANNARKELLTTGNLKYQPSARKTYSDAFESLSEKLRIAQSNRPRERKAQLIANSVVAAKKKENPDMDKKEIKKISQRALTDARARVGAARTPIDISDREWEAIQAGAISDHQLWEILKYADDSRLRELATPKEHTQVQDIQIARMKTYAKQGFTNAQIADALGLSTSTVSKYLRAENIDKVTKAVESVGKLVSAVMEAGT